MATLLWVLWVCYLLIALRWVWGAVEVSRAPLDLLSLPALPERSPQPDDPTLTVLIAAHNEADHIEDCIARLSEQNYRLPQIIVVNDRSTDGTGEAVRRLAAHDPRIRVVDVHRLPEGWIGKTHALSQGAAQAQGDYLLFLDSDVFLRPGAIAAVMQRAASQGIEFLTLWPRLALRSTADRLLVPPVGWVLSFWSWIGSGAAKATGDAAVGNGQFLLVRRDAYERIGGHAAVAAELAEDAMMASNAMRAGLKRYVGLGSGLYVAARSSTFSRCTNGLARVLIGSLVTPWKVLVSTQFILGGCVTPFWILPLALGLMATGFDPAATTAWAAAATLHLIGMFLTLRRLFAMTLEERGPLWLFPIGCLITVGLLVWSLRIMTGRARIRWGATRYRVRGSQVFAPTGD